MGRDGDGRALRGGRSPYAVYLGTRDNRLPRVLAAGVINTAKVRVVIVTSTSAVINTMTNQPITGSELLGIFTASAGTMLFIDVDALPMAQLSIPQAHAR